MAGDPLTQGEMVKFSGEESRAMHDAAEAWEGMMTMLDERAQARQLEELR
jgi:hypothetical protein